LKHRGKEMIKIDGTSGEGGGQILRTSLGLSLITGKPFQINKIRAKRKKSGLLRQHLTAVRAAIQIGRAESSGDEICSSELKFIPKTIYPGKYNFAIGSAGSCSLVLQAVLPALLTANSPSVITVKGGSHNPYAPPFDFLKKTFLPLLNQMGAKLSLSMDSYGFYPAGGGQITLHIEPVPELKPLELTEFGDISKKHVNILLSGLPVHIGNREMQTIKNRLNLKESELSITQVDSHGPGNVLTAVLKTKHLTETFTGFGRKGISAERVARELCKAVNTYLENRVPVGIYLADQLLIPLALAGSGKFHTAKPSLHTITNARVIEKFLPVNININQISNKKWEIEICKRTSSGESL
jgi:RNA 3'-terminal phosphate cyclase (ATP)